MSWNIVEMVKVVCRECGADFLMREDDNYIFCMSCESVLSASRSFPMEVGA